MICRDLKEMLEILDLTAGLVTRARRAHQDQWDRMDLTVSRAS